jgi:ubiquinone biosynthesis protein
LILRKRYLKRFQKIINTMVRHGFGQMIYDLGITQKFPFSWRRREKKDVQRISKAVRIRMVLEELGPTFVKFGQLLSTRSDIIPSEYQAELRKLQDQVPPFPFSEIKNTVESELGKPLSVLFKSFEEAPLAAASIGQVHSAILNSGEKVAVKVQRPQIREIIKQDLYILKELAILIDKHTNLGRLYNFEGIVEQFTFNINMELNYYQEGRNAEQIKNNFQKDDTVYIFEIYWDLTTQKVLTMGFVDGIKLNNKDALKEGGFSLKKIVENLSNAYFKQVLLDGFFHADPHPGNIGVLPDGKIFFMDFGIAGNLNESQRNNFNRLLLGFFLQDTNEIVSGIIGLGVVTEKTDKKQLKLELDRLLQKYYNLPLKDIHLGESMHELMGIAFKQQIRLPTEFTLLAKTFLTLEGLLSELEPNFNVSELLKPFGKKLARRRFSLQKIGAGFFKNAGKYLGLVETFPEYFLSILEKGAAGNIELKLEISDKERILNRLNNMVNRLSFSIVLASIIIGLCLTVKFTDVSLFGRFPITEIGLLAAAIMAFFWLFAILRSGRL